MTDLTTIISEPLVQGGIAGAVILYCLVTDFTQRRENRRIEAARILREEQREIKAQAREEKCEANMRELQAEHRKELRAITHDYNKVMQVLVVTVRKHFKVHMDTPVSELETDKYENKRPH